MMANIPISINPFLNTLGLFDTIEATMYSVKVSNIMIRIPWVIPSELICGLVSWNRMKAIQAM